MLTPITSSMLSHIGYDAERLVLLVRFHPSKKQAAAAEPGDLWEYRDVIPDKWAEAQAVIADPNRTQPRRQLCFADSHLRKRTHPKGFGHPQVRCGWLRLGGKTKLLVPPRRKAI